MNVKNAVIQTIAMIKASDPRIAPMPAFFLTALYFFQELNGISPFRLLVSVAEIPAKTKATELLTVKILP